MPQYAVPVPGQAAPNLEPQPPAPAPPPDRPGWLPQKFSSPEDLALAYANLEARLATQGQPQAPASQQQPPVAPPGTQGPKELRTEVMENLYNEYEQLGGLSAQTYAMLRNEYGLPQQIVDAHISALRGKAELEAQEMYNVVGGKDAYERMVGWAGRQLSPADRAAYDGMIRNANKTGDKNLVRMAVEALALKWRASEGYHGQQAPRVTLGGPVSPNGLSNAPYQSVEEFHADQRKPEYKTNEAFRNNVIERWAASRGRLLGEQQWT